MITTSDKKTIIKYLGNHYSRAIVPALQNLNIVNRYGKYYSNRSINDIVNGVTENIAVETEIFKMVSNKKKQLKKLQTLKDTL